MVPTNRRWSTWVWLLQFFSHPSSSPQTWKVGRYQPFFNRPGTGRLAGDNLPAGSDTLWITSCHPPPLHCFSYGTKMKNKNKLQPRYQSRTFSSNFQCNKTLCLLCILFIWYRILVHSLKSTLYFRMPSPLFVESSDNIAASITTSFLQWAVVAINVLSALPVPSPLVKDDEEVCLIMNDRHHNRTSIIEKIKPAGQSWRGVANHNRSSIIK